MISSCSLFFNSSSFSYSLFSLSCSRSALSLAYSRISSSWSDSSSLSSSPLSALSAPSPSSPPSSDLRAPRSDYWFSLEASSLLSSFLSLSASGDLLLYSGRVVSIFYFFQSSFKTRCVLSSPLSSSSGSTISPWARFFANLFSLSSLAIRSLLKSILDCSFLHP